LGIPALGNTGLTSFPQKSNANLYLNSQIGDGDWSPWEDLTLTEALPDIVPDLQNTSTEFISKSAFEPQAALGNIDGVAAHIDVPFEMAYQLPDNASNMDLSTAGFPSGFTM
jgi:hypothetical protein